MNKTLMTLGLISLLSIPSFLSAKQRVTRNYAANYLGITQNAMTCSLGYCMHTSTYHDIVLFTGVDTKDVKVVSRGGDCSLEGNVSISANQDVLEAKLKEVDILKPKFIIEFSEALAYKRKICAEYKQEQEKIASSPKNHETIAEQKKIEQRQYIFSKDLVGKVSVEEAARSALAPSLKVTPHQDKNGCNYQYDKSELNKIDPQKLNELLNKIDNGDFNITLEEIIPHLQNFCKQEINNI